jgi:hypothetical protein
MRRTRRSQEAAPASAPDLAYDPVPPPQSGPPSRQEIFQRAIREAQARGAAAAYPAERPPSPYHDKAAAAASPGNRAQGGRPKYRIETGHDDGPAYAASEHDDRRPRRTTAPQPSEPHSDRRNRGRAIGRGRQDAGAQAPEWPAGRSRLPTILLAVVIVGTIAGLGALAWSERTTSADRTAGSDRGPASAAAIGAVPTPPDAQSKSDDRLPGEPEADSSVRVVGEPDVPVPPDASTDPIADTIANASPTTTDAAVGGRPAVLYEEPLDAAAGMAGVTPVDAVVSWRFVEHGSTGPEILADLEVPERGISIRLVLRQNADPSLPASHLVAAVINTSPDFPGRGIRSVPRLVLKASEDERGEPLIGAPAKIADGFFWIALSATESDVGRNLLLLRERAWIDLPLVYDTGQRAILSFEKGPEGAEVFESALAAWGPG